MNIAEQKSQQGNLLFTRVMNLKYKSKYNNLKHQIKNLVFDNAALCDNITQVQDELAISRNERRYIIKRLMRYEDFIDNDQTQHQPSVFGHIRKKRGPKKQEHHFPLPTNLNCNSNTDRQISTSSSNPKLYENNTMILSKPVFPLNMGNIILHSLGEIIVSNTFHNANYIFPVGYVASRIYAHPRDPKRKCVYTCKILNNAGKPQFQIIPDNNLDGVFFGETADICHKGLIETLQRSLLGVKLTAAIEGEIFFGLTNSTVRTLLEADESFKMCLHFKGFKSNDILSTKNEENDPTINFDALQSLMSSSHLSSNNDKRDDLLEFF